MNPACGSIVPEIVVSETGFKVDYVISFLTQPPSKKTTEIYYSTYGLSGLYRNYSGSLGLLFVNAKVHGMVIKYRVSHEKKFRGVKKI